MPLLKRLGLPATARASLGLYTVRADFDPLLEAIRRARKLFG
jgi:cysteine desulfurase/selenocysteine lyase